MRTLTFPLRAPLRGPQLQGCGGGGVRWRGRGQYQLYIAAKEAPVLLKRPPDPFDCELGSQRRHWTKLEECNFFSMPSAVLYALLLHSMKCGIIVFRLQAGDQQEFMCSILLGFALLPRSSVYVPAVHSKRLKDGKQIDQFHRCSADTQSQLLIATFPSFWRHTSLRVTVVYVRVDRGCRKQITQQIDEISGIDVITV